MSSGPQGIERLLSSMLGGALVSTTLSASFSLILGKDIHTNFMSSANPFPTMSSAMRTTVQDMGPSLPTTAQGWHLGIPENTSAI